MRWRWIPWKFMISRAVRAYRILDPIRLVAQLTAFSRSSVPVPMELLRVGVVFQARGLINARVIQYNLDWIWPYWVVRPIRPTIRSCRGPLPSAMSI